MKGHSIALLHGTVYYDASGTKKRQGEVAESKAISSNAVAVLRRIQKPVGSVWKKPRACTAVEEHETYN